MGTASSVELQFDERGFFCSAKLGICFPSLESLMCKFGAKYVNICSCSIKDTCRLHSSGYNLKCRF